MLDILLAAGCLILMLAIGIAVTRNVSQQPERELGYLEGLRGYAALIVVVQHFLVIFFPGFVTALPALNRLGFESDIAFTPLGIFYNGTLAVFVFFVLSGFVLSYRYFKTSDCHIIASGLCRRYLRLVWPILATLWVYMLFYDWHWFQYFPYLVHPGYLPQWQHLLHNYHPTVSTVFKTALLNAFGLGRLFSPNESLWTIAYEFTGSLFVFAFLWLFGRRPVWRHVAYAGCLGFIVKPFLFAFAAGMFLSDLSVKGHLHFCRRPVYFSAAALLAVYLACFTGSIFVTSYPPFQLTRTVFAWLQPWMVGRHYHLIRSIILSTGASLILLLVLISPHIQKILMTRFARFLGKISFSLYLIHLAVLPTLTTHLCIFLQPHWGFTRAALFSFGVTLAVMFVISYYLYLFCDRAAVQISRWVYNHLVYGLKQMLLVCRRP